MAKTTTLTLTLNSDIDSAHAVFWSRAIVLEDSECTWNMSLACPAYHRSRASEACISDTCAYSLPVRSKVVERAKGFLRRSEWRTKVRHANILVHVGLAIKKQGAHTITGRNSSRLSCRIVGFGLDLIVSTWS